MLVGSWRWCALFINRCPKASRLRGAPGWYVGQPLLRAACSEPSLAESHTSPQPLLATLLVSGHPSLKKAFWVKTVCQPVPVTPFIFPLGSSGNILLHTWPLGCHRPPRHLPGLLVHGLKEPSSQGPVWQPRLSWSPTTAGSSSCYK